MAAAEPWSEYTFDPIKALWVDYGDGHTDGYLLEGYDSTVTGTNIVVVTADRTYCVRLTETSTIRDDVLIVTVDGKNYKILTKYNYRLTAPLCKLATTSNELIGSTTVTKQGSKNSLGFVIFSKDGTMYTSNAYSAITEKFDIDITDSIDESTLSLNITVTGLESGTGGSLTLSVPIDKIDPGNPYLYLLYFNE